MIIRLFQLNVIPGQPSENASKIINAINDAKNNSVDLIIFPEMAVPGYLLGDEWERQSFLRDCQSCTEDIKNASTNICVVFGSVAIDWTKKNEDGRVRKYNALYVAENGHFLLHPATNHPYFIKMLMPNYREFDDSRHFFDPRKLAYELDISVEDLIQPVQSSLGLLGCILCEDGWDEDYNISPLTVLAKRNAEFFINISSSPYTFNKNVKRTRVFSEHAKQFRRPLLYVNNTGLQDNAKTIFTFDGASRAYTSNGNVHSTIESFSQDYVDIDAATLINETSPNAVCTDDNIANQFRAIQFGAKAFMQRIGLEKVVIGVSGGIDSAVVAAIFRTFMAPENLLLVSMPGPFTSATTRNLAKQLANNLNCPFAEIPIAASVELTKTQLLDTVFEYNGGCKSLSVSDFVLENIQARDRSSRILAAVSAAFGGAFTCNANKTEMTVGYSTLYGDLGGFIAPIADLWKGEVYSMAQYLNDTIYQTQVIPLGTINVIPSAELSAQQNVDDGKGDPLHYPYHDALFASWVEFWNRATPEENLKWYLDGTLGEKLGYFEDIKLLFPTAQSFVSDLERWWNLYQGMAVAKRVQAPPVLAIKRRAFGFDHRESQIGPRYSRKYFQYKSQI